MWHHNVDLLVYHDLDAQSRFKLALQEADDRFFLYVGGFWHSGWIHQHLEGPAADGFVAEVARGRTASAAFALPAGVDGSLGRLIRALVRALSGWSDVLEPGREVQA
jgi:hypothetical protein